MGKIDEAIKDLRYLLDRGYRKTIALKFVADHYLLSKKERNYLSRHVFSRRKIKERKSKIIKLKNIKNKKLLIDGYNVLITVENIIRNSKDIFIAQDGFLRDCSAVFGKHKISTTTYKALKAIITTLKKYQPKYVVFYLDKNVSFSGELAKRIRACMSKHKVNGEVILSNKVDYILKKEGKKGNVVATSDSVIIDNVKQVVDIPKEILKCSNTLLS